LEKEGPLGDKYAEREPENEEIASCRLWPNSVYQYFISNAYLSRLYILF
jgi:hypothetical protein